MNDFDKIKSSLNKQGSEHLGDLVNSLELLD